jgi:hypothetical protein
VDNIFNQAILKYCLFKQNITLDQFETAKKEFPVGFQQSNIFVKIGLFIFTNIIILAAGGLFLLFFGEAISGNRLVGPTLSLIAAFSLFWALENSINGSKFYRSGVDNALFYAALGFTLLFFVSITDYNSPDWVYLTFSLLILFLALMRYSDLLTAVGLYYCWIALWFVILSKFSIGKLILPFVMMFMAALSYYAVKIWKKQTVTNYYHDCQVIIEILALVVFYLGGNYFVVREGNAQLNNLSVSVQIAFAPLFYFFSSAIPLIYVFVGLKKHDRIMLIVGLIAIAFSIFTYRNYFSILPIEWALTIGGIVLILLSAFVIQFLNTEKYGLTYVLNSEDKHQNLQAFAISQIISTPNQPEGTKFGEGDFGGAGAGSEY